MENNKKLENYLTRLDQVLSGISVGDRADMITEIRSHILEAQERDPGKSLDAILTSLGEPEAVGNRYLLERGIKPGKPPKSPWVKWLTIGFLGIFGMGFLVLALLVFKFTPLVRVDGKAGSVQLLGGLFDIKDDVHGSYEASGEMELNPTEVGELKIIFANGKIALKQTADHHLRWACESSVSGENPIVQQRSVLFAFANVKCEISYPESLSLKVEGANAKVVMNRLKSAVTAKLGNGKVTFVGAQNTNYRYDLKVGNGNVDSFESSNHPDAVPVKIEIQNGSISKEG